MCNKSIMYLNELVDDFVFGTNHGLNLIVCKTLSYTYTSSWLWGWKELYKLQTQKSVYAMHSTILRGLFDLQKCAKTTQNKTKTILHLYFNCWKKANLCETQIWKYMARQTNEQTRGGGAGHSTYSCLLPPQTTRGPEYSISYNNSAPGNSVCRYRYDP